MTSWHHNIWQNKIYFTNYVILLARYLYWQRSQKMIEWTTFEQRPAVLILIFDHVTWTSIRVIYSLWVFTVPSFATSKQRGQKTLSGQHFFNDQQSDLDLWLCDLKINRGHLLPMGFHTWISCQYVPTLATFKQKDQKILSGL